MSDYQMYEVVRVKDDQTYDDFNDRQRAIDAAKAYAKDEGNVFKVVRKIVTTTRTPIGTYHPS